jgi:HEAT repeat protein
LFALWHGLVNLWGTKSSSAEDNMARPCTQLALIALLCSLFAVAARADDDHERLAELWRVGSLWQVGDNIPRVAEARQAIVDAGEPGLEFALSRLHASETLEIRCLYAVITGFGQQAIEPLTGHISHEAAAARRNVAELLRRLNARDAADALLQQARAEQDIGARLAQLTALSGWEEAAAVPLIARTSRHQTDRVRHRAAGLLAPYADRAATGRLLEMLHDDVYFVREAAVDALRTGTEAGRARALNALKGLNGREAGPRIWRLLIRAAATCEDAETGRVLAGVLAHADAGVRGEAASALADWHRGAGQGQDQAPSRSALEAALAQETDPFASPQMKSALQSLNQQD